MFRRFFILSFLFAGCATTTPKMLPSSPQPPSSSSSSDENLVKKQGIEHLNLDLSIDISKDGTYRKVRHISYRIKKAEAISYMGIYRLAWNPTYEKKPVIEAKVITPDGQTYVLDPKTISDQSLSEKGAVLSDQRRLNAPLPGLCIGAKVDIKVVEEIIKTPLGTGYFFGAYFPASKAFGLRFSFPAKTKYVVDPGWTKLKLLRREEGGRLILEAKQNNYKPYNLKDTLLAPSLLSNRYFILSTHKSWKAIGNRYHQRIAKNLRSDHIHELITNINSGSVRDKVAKVLSRIHKRVRYTGIEFGQSAIVPYAPHETLKRGFGDCKDKSALLIAALSAIGIDAKIALVNAGGMDLKENIPSFEQFNHAIVYLPKENLWIDPASRELAVGLLFSGVQDRYALVIDKEKSGLKRTVSFSAKENKRIDTHRISLDINGKATIDTEIKYHGFLSLNIGKDSEDEESLKKYSKLLLASLYKEPKVHSVKIKSDMKYPSKVLRIKGTALIDGMGENRANYVFELNRLIAFLPGAMRRFFAKSEYKKRHYDAYNPVPHYYEMRYIFKSIDGYDLESFPSAREEEWGKVKFVQRTIKHKDGKVEVRFSIEVPRHLKKEELKIFAHKAFVWGEEQKPSLIFKDHGLALLSKGKAKLAIDHYHKLIKKHPDQPAYRSYYAARLSNLGFMHEATRQAELALGSKPTHWLPYYMAAYTLTTGRLSDRFGASYQADKAIKILKQGIKRVANPVELKLLMVKILSKDRSGSEIVQPNKRLDEAIRVLETLKKDKQDVDDQIIDLMIVQRRYKDAQARLTRLTRNTARDLNALLLSILQQNHTVAIEQFERFVQSAEGKSFPVIMFTLMRYGAYEEMDGFFKALAKKYPKMKKTLGNRIDFFGQLRRTDLNKKTKLERFIKNYLVKLIKRDYNFYQKHTIKLANEKAMQRAFDKMGESVRGGHFASMNKPLMIDIVRSMSFSKRGSAKAGYIVQLGFKGFQASNVQYFIIPSGRSFKVVADNNNPQMLAGYLHSAYKKKKFAVIKLGSGFYLDQRKKIKILQDIYRRSGSLTKKRYEDLIGFMLLDDNQAKGLTLAQNVYKHIKSPALKRRIEMLFFYHLTEAKAYEEAEKIAKVLIQDDPMLELPLLSRVYRGRRYYKRLIKLLEKQPKTNEMSQMMHLSSGFASAGKLKKAIAYLESQLNTSLEKKERATMLNNYVWYCFIANHKRKDWIKYAKEANLLSGGKDKHKIHTLGSVLAEQDDILEAVQVLNTLTKDEYRAKPSQWYIRGIIAYKLGLKEIAKQAFEKSMEEEDRDGDSIYISAQKYLKKLKAI